MRLLAEGKAISGLAVAAAGIAIGVFLATGGCASGRSKASDGRGRILRLATTTSTVESGLLDALLPVFSGRTGIEVEVISRGTGAAIELAREGGADILLAHAREAENAFVMEGYGVNRVELMYNDFVLLGPPGDPAGVRGGKDIVKALSKVRQLALPFISRGDRSGTNMRELSLWRLAGVKADGPWYVEARKGMRETLELADQRGAYVLADRSTYLFNQERVGLVVAVEADKRLFNVYGVTVVNPLKVQGVNFPGAMALLAFLTSAEGQEIIRDYGKERFGRPLFVPLVVH